LLISLRVCVVKKKEESDFGFGKEILPFGGK